jgi:hypothetical protein
MAAKLIALLSLLFARAPQSEDALLQQIAASGRCATLAESPDARVASSSAIAPGQPPLLSFRYYEGQQHGRFGNSDLMLDDAGH